MMAGMVVGGRMVTMTAALAQGNSRAASPPLEQTAIDLVEMPALESCSDKTTRKQPSEKTTSEKGGQKKDEGCEEKDSQEKKEEPCPTFWEKNPPVRVFPRPGNFAIPPSGEGFYSLEDEWRGNWREKPPRFPYPPFGFIQFSFFDADFRYLDDPKNQQYDCFDCLHRIHREPCWLFSTGGDVRWRSMHEVNSQLSGKNNDYDLLRTRVYADLWYGNRFRFYAEYLDAQIFGEELDPLPIDRNRSDLLNAFVDLRIDDHDDQPTYLRLGRQELLFGSQRLISPLDWANTRRTFQGARAFRQGEKFDVDVFWVQPVIPDPSNFDSTDSNQNFAGLWTTYRPEPGHFLDAYYLVLDNDNRLTPRGTPAVPYTVHTVGSRWTGDRNHVLWDVEGMLQFGDRGDEGIMAGAATAGLGYHFDPCCWNPTFWVYYDYASGDGDPAGGDFHTFNQLFPFGHYYLGWLDLVGRRNIHDLNCHLWLYPRKWITLWLQYHHFRLDQSRDALYNAAGVPIRISQNGTAGTDVGDEVDLVINFHLTTYTDLVLCYSKLFAGEFIQQTGPPGDAEMFFVQYSLRW
jgi:hypothetical protein